MNKRQYKKWWKYCDLSDPLMRRFSPRTIRLFERQNTTWLGGKGRKGKYKYRPPKSQIFIDEFVFHREQTDEELPFVEVKDD